MIKKFDEWNTLKKSLEYDERHNPNYFHEREIWWASLGLNIGHEEDGKNINYERPVLVIRKFNKKALWIVPPTSKEKIDKTHYHQLVERIDTQKDSVVILSQLKLVSSKRLLRKLGYISQHDFEQIISKIKKLFPSV
jgi:mRNA interferase MazF